MICVAIPYPAIFLPPARCLGDLLEASVTKGSEHFVFGIVDQNISVREIKNFRAAVFAIAVPTRVPQLPADLESNGGLAGACCHSEEDLLLSLQHGLDDPVDGNFVIVALAFADGCVGWSQKSVRGLIIFDLFAGSKALPQVLGFGESLEMAFLARREVELDDAMPVGRIVEFHAKIAA
jgi:hypothetical protein